MRLDIRARCGLTSDEARHAERSFRFALGRFGLRLARASVTMADLNGPKGGVDKSCAVEVRGEGVEVRIEERAATVREALDFAAARAGRAVARAIDRSRRRVPAPRSTPGRKAQNGGRG